MKEWKILFRAAAAFNLAVGIPLFIAPEATVAVIGTIRPVDLALMKVTGALIICFGIIYMIAGSNPARCRPVIWAALVGKTGVAFVYLPDWFDGTIPVGAVLIALCDLSLTIASIYFLFRPLPNTGFRADRVVGA